MTAAMDLYARALSSGGHGVAHLMRRGTGAADRSWTRCDVSTVRMQKLIFGAVREVCERCASTCDADDAVAFLDGIVDGAIHAIVTEGPAQECGVLQKRHVDRFARVLRPGGHVFVLRPSLDPGYYDWFAIADLEFRGSIVRIASTPIEKVRKRDDLSRRAEFFDLYRKRFDGTVASCLRRHQTGGFRRVSAERPFCDVIHTDDRDDFLAQIRRASLPLGVGTILDPFRLRRDEISRDPGGES